MSGLTLLRKLARLKQAAPGIPDRRDLGDETRLRPGALATLVSQLHEARRAGRHFDHRLGDQDVGLLSWAARKDLPAPGDRIGAFRQPVHSWDYRDFEGEIPEGYGAGTVKKHRQGQVLITDVKPGKILFSTADSRHPERFALVRTKDKNWLLANTTPRFGKDWPESRKPKYKLLKPEQVEPALKSLQPGSSVQAKIDGASTMARLLRHGVELVSYRPSRTTGRPIPQTERVLPGRAKMDIPSGWRNSELRGEIYGLDREGRAIPPQALGGLLNSTLAKSLEDQRMRSVRLKTMLFDVSRKGGKAVDPNTVPYRDRLSMLREIMPALPGDSFHMPEDIAGTPQEALALWRKVQEGRHPLTTEGVILQPSRGPGAKAKTFQETNVPITGTFPGRGRRAGAVGGLTYGLPGGGVGRVGSGFDESTLADISRDPESWRGRIARIRSQETLPSGAHRGPVFIGLSEDRNA